MFSIAWHIRLGLYGTVGTENIVEIEKEPITIFCSGIYDFGGLFRYLTAFCHFVARLNNETYLEHCSFEEDLFRSVSV